MPTSEDHVAEIGLYLNVRAWTESYRNLRFMEQRTANTRRVQTGGHNGEFREMGIGDECCIKAQEHSLCATENDAARKARPILRPSRFTAVIRVDILWD